MRDALEGARAGRSAKFLIAGEAGVGKSRLAAEFADVAYRENVLVLSGGCVDLGDGSAPYAPIVEALRTWVRGASDAELEAILGPWRSDLAPLVPELRPTRDEIPAGLAGGRTVYKGQGHLFEILLAVLQRLAAKEPVVLLVEDLHWSDRSTRDLLAFLVPNVRNLAVLLVMTYRSDELHRRHPLLPFLAELERSGRVARIELDRFDRGELAAQLRAIAGPDLDPRLIDLIHARSEGNAFFAEELLASARDHAPTTLPPSLRDVLMARVGGLTDRSQELLRIASAAGQRVDPALVAAAMGTDVSVLDESLRESVSQQILIPDVAPGEERYAFRHALLQEAVYEDLLPGERTRLHAAFARTLGEARAAGDTSRLSELAFHWYAARDLPRAFEAVLDAALAAEAGSAFPEALAHYERALELWDHVPEPESRAGRDRVDLLATAGSVARYCEPSRAVSHVRAALRMVDERADPMRAGLLNERLGRYAWIAGQGQVALDAYRRAMSLISAEPPSEARARAVAGLSQILMLQNRYAESRRLADEAIKLAKVTGARQIEGHALNTRAMDRVRDGEVDQALADMDNALRIAEEVGDVDDIDRAYCNRIDVLSVAGRLDDAVDVANAGIGVAKRLGMVTFWGTHYLCNAANLLFLLGRWEESEAARLQAEEIGAQGINAILVRELRARLALARGQFALAEGELRALRPLAEQAADGQVIAPVHASLAELALWQRRPVDAAKIVAPGLAAVAHSNDIEHSELYALAIRAQADITESGRARRSADDVARAVAQGRELHDALRRRLATIETETRSVLQPQSAAWRALCGAEMSRLEGIPDPEAWAAAVRGWDALGRPYFAAYALWREAEALLTARHDRKQAAAVLARATDIATTLGAEPLRREVAALALRARLSLVPSAPDVPDAASQEATRLGLTAREREVLALVALGRTNRQIGTELFISEKTAGFHVSNILGKLGVSGRGEAAAHAHWLGLAESANAPRHD